MNDYLRQVLGALCLLGGAVWLWRAVRAYRRHQREEANPVNGYWGRVFAREAKRRMLGDICAACIVVGIGVFTLVHILR